MSYSGDLAYDYAATNKREPEQTQAQLKKKGPKENGRQIFVYIESVPFAFI